MTYKTFCSKPEEVYPSWMVSRETKIDQSVLITGQQEITEITDKTYQTSVSIDKPDAQENQKPKDQPLTVRDTKTTVMSKRIGPKPFDKTYQVSVLAQQGDTERQQGEDEYPPWVKDTKVEKMITVSGERQGPKPFDKTYEASIMVSKHPDETDSRPDDKYPPWVKDTRIEKTTMITDERKRPKPFDKTYQTSVTMATKKPTESKKKSGVVYPPWMKDTQVDQTTTVTAEEWRKPQPDDQMYQTSVVIPKKPDGAKRQPGVTYPPWMKDTQVDQTTTVTSEEWRKPQPDDQMYQTSVAIPKKPDGAKRQPGVPYPAWMKDTQVDQTTAEEWRKPQLDDQMYQTSVAIPKKPDRAKRQPGVPYPPWMKDTQVDQTTTVTAEEWRKPQPDDQMYQTSVAIPKKPDGAKRQPGVPYPAWMKDTQVDQTTAEEWRKPQLDDQMYQTSVAIPKKPDRAKRQPGVPYPPWMKDTQVDQTTTVTAEEWRKPQPDDQMYQTSVTIPGKLDEAKKQPRLTFPPWVKDTVKDERQAPTDEKFRTSAVVKKKLEVEKKPKVQLPPWIKDTEKATSVTAEKKVWKPIDKKFQTSVTTTVQLPKEQEKPEDVCPPWAVTDTQIDKRMTITAMGKSMKPEDEKFESSVTITGKEKYPRDETKIVTTEMKVSTFPGPLQKGVVLAEKKFPKKVPIVPTKPKPTKITETETKVVSPDKTVGIGIHQTDTTTNTVMEKFPLVPAKLVIEVEDLKLKIPEKEQYQVICPYPHEDFMMLEAVFASPWKPSTDSVWEAVIALEQQPMRLETSGLF